jgi:hypothetical protein
LSVAFATSNPYSTHHKLTDLDLDLRKDAGFYLSEKTENMQFNFQFVVILSSIF